jgi:hypothetical protein
MPSPASPALNRMLVMTPELDERRPSLEPYGTSEAQTAISRQSRRTVIYKYIQRLALVEPGGIEPMW